MVGDVVMSLLMNGAGGQGLRWGRLLDDSVASLSPPWTCLLTLLAKEEE